jgi:hypothetical protein
LRPSPWTRTTSISPCDDGWLYRLAKTGDAALERIAAAAAPGSSYTNGIAVDDTYVYWTALGDGVSHGAIERAPKTGGPAQALALAEARPMGIAVDDGYVYWSTRPGYRRLPIPILGSATG